MEACHLVCILTKQLLESQQKIFTAARFFLFLHPAGQAHGRSHEVINIAQHFSLTNGSINVMFSVRKHMVLKQNNVQADKIFVWNGYP
jgi:hypothetical protein